MPVRYSLRMQFGLDLDPKQLGKKLVKLCRQARVDEVVVFFFAEELNDGHDEPARIRQWVEHSRIYRQMLTKAGVSVSLNPWHTVLHADRFRTRKPGQNWQPMVDPRGLAAGAVVCPLDPGWRAYYDQSLELYAREGLRVIWIDDDIRMHNHPPLHWGGCFCPLHVAEFNRRMGVSASREEIVARCLQAGEPHPWRGAWLDMWEDTHLQMISHWRELCAAHGAKLGLMSSLPEYHAAEGRRWENWWQAFAGPEAVSGGGGVGGSGGSGGASGAAPAAIHRPHFWGYGDVMGSSLPDSLARLDQNRNIQPAAIESGPEIECFTYGQWHKSFRQLHAQMAAALVLGSNNLNISIYDFLGNDPDDEPQRATFLRKWRDAADWLADEFPMTLRTVGVGLPWSQDMGRLVHTAADSDDWHNLLTPPCGWSHWLGAAGIAFSTQPQQVNALAGPVAWAFSDAQLRTWLSQGLLLDGEAAMVLLQRGLGEMIGMTAGRFITQADKLYSVERCTDERASQRLGAQMGINVGGHAQRLLQGRLLPGTQVLSDLRTPTLEVVGHGLTYCQNSLGGRVAIVPWNASRDTVMNIQRAWQLRKLLHLLDPQNTCGQARGGPWLIPQFLSDGTTWRGVVWNTSPDAISRFELFPPAAMPTPTEIIHLDANGKRQPGKIDGNLVQLRQPLQQWELVVVK